jgi:YesN/AraC family two-component response regulator
MIYQSSKTILVIEDDAITRNIFLDALEAEGFVTIAAENGQFGIQQAEKYLPDLIISDLLMPDIDGYTVLTKLRENHLTAIIPFIFLTASNSKEAMRKGMELGADDYLSKPATVDELLKAISVRLERQSMIKSLYENNSQAVSELTVKAENPESIFPNIPHLQKVFDYIDTHYHQGITLSDVAKAVGYSSAYLTNQVSKQTGKTVHAWIVQRRITAACHLLKHTNLTVEEVADKVGYQNACHFSRQFSSYLNLAPTSWRKKHQLPSVAASASLQFINSRSQIQSSPSYHSFQYSTATD